MAGSDRSADREKALESALIQIERQFGKGSVMRLGDEARAPVEVIPTGSIALDVALGIGGLPRGRVVEIYGPEGGGKALALDTPIPTPKGWTTMGELSPGQEVFASDGSPTRVTFITPVMTDHECFRVKFSDDAEIIADADHQWVTTTLWGRTDRWSPGVVTTREIAATLRARDGHALNHAIPACGPLEYPAQELPVEPYTFGAWLGDGTTANPPASLQAELRKLGVLGNKHIPEGYLHGSVAQRLALLQGLMDTDGTVGADGAGTGRGSGRAKCEFSVVHERLARDVHELLLGLGIKVTFRSAPAVLEGRQVGVRYRLVFQTELPVFRLPRKAERLTPLRTRRATLRYITAVEPVASVPVRCIQVDDPSHTYLAGRECIPTHNTSLALTAIANAQRAGGIAAFVDAEHALDPDYAQKIGVDTDALLVSQPDTGEQALEIADMLIRSGAIDIIVVDSVAALVPRAEIEGEMGDSHVGLQARLMSQALRKLTGAINQTKTTVIFINQLREKVGVMFGCASWYTWVTLADGSRERIGKIVNQKMPVEVLSYDPALGRIVPKKVVNWFNNGQADEFLHFVVERSGGGTGHGRAIMDLTRNHLVRTPGGWREAQEIAVGDRVLLAQPSLLSDKQVQVILGALMGDGSLSKPVRRDDESARFRMGHGSKQAGYLNWKVSLLGNIPHAMTTNAKHAVFADFTPLSELAELRGVVYFGDGKKHLTWEYLKKLTPLALAVWYMDDGCFTIRSKGVQQRTEGGTGRIEICVEAMSPGSRERLAQYLRDNYGLEVKLTAKGAHQVSVLRFTTAASEKFQQIVAPYIHPTMDYKLLPRFRGQFSVEPEFKEPTIHPVPARVLSIKPKSDLQIMSRYDIEVEGSHNYLADGIVVHNSPETTSGGRALKFYASVRLDVRRIETLKDGTDAVGNRIRVKVVKNKVAPPFRQAEMDLLFGVGISREGGLIDLGVEQGIVRKSGAWYTYEGDQLGQGKENARGFLHDNPDIANAIEKKIKEKLGVGARLDAEAGAPKADGSKADAPKADGPKSAGGPKSKADSGTGKPGTN